MSYNSNFLLTNKKCNCTYCNKEIYVKNLTFKDFVGILKSNVDLKSNFLNPIMNSMNESLKGESINLSAFILSDYKAIIYILETMFKGDIENSYDKFINSETSIRNDVCEYLLNFIELNNISIFCNSGCKSNNTKSKNCIKKPKSNEEILSNIYNVTDRRLGTESLLKIEDKLKFITINSNSYFNNISFGNKPYHLITKYKSGYLHITPYCVWFVSPKGDILYAYNNINDRYKGSLKKILDLAINFDNNYIFNTAFLLYDGRKNVDIFTK